MKKNIFLIFIVLPVIFLFISCSEKTKEKTEERRAKIAFVIDDWGYNNRYLDIVFDIDRPVTLSILPNLRYSTYIAESIQKNNSLYDVMVHLPMESKSGKSAEEITILSNTTEKDIISIIDKSLKTVPGAIGISCHQGSKLTEDERAVRIILKELKKRDLFFLDSITTPRSVCGRIAKDIGVKAAKRDVFLDITDQTDMDNFEFYIRKQMHELINEALLKGSAIGIGHNKKATLKVIKEYIPKIEKKGIKIVPLKELAE